MIELLEDMGISMTFNVVDLREFHKNVPLYPESSSRTSFFEDEWTDEGQIRQDTFCFQLDP